MNIDNIEGYRDTDRLLTRKEVEDNEVKKMVYKALIDFANDLKGMTDKAFERYGFRLKFSDVFYEDEFHGLWFGYMDGKITKDELKAKIREKLAYANTRTK